MLWDAGQERINREAKARLVERYVTGRDAYVGAQVALGRAKTNGVAYSPAYVRSEAPAPSAAAQRATLGRIGRMFPGAVRRRDS